MITGFKHRGLKRWFERGDASGLNPEHLNRVTDILTELDSVQDIEELNHATFRLHPLIGNRAGDWSVTVRRNWRITFRFEDGNAYNVNYEDYH